MLTNKREIYKPFEFPEAFKYYKAQQGAFWSADEVAMAKDIHDWQHELTDSERQVLGQILKSFTQVEISVNDYWRKVASWFPKPEISMMASSFSFFETIHTEGYAYLNDSLGIDDYSAFLQDETAVAKLDNLKNVDQRSLKGKMQSLAIFSAFNEGVNLFSSFAILMNFSRFNLMKGLETINAWSARDENLHSEAGCWLFRTLVKENPKLMDKEMKRSIYEAARCTVNLEDNFIDNAFSLGTIRGLDHKDLKNYIRMRANKKLQELGLKTNWKNIDKESLHRMDWFDSMLMGRSTTDFFAKRETEYARCTFTVDNLFGE